MFKAADTDGSGLIELEEFLNWWKREELKQQGHPDGVDLSAIKVEAESDDDIDDDSAEAAAGYDSGYSSC